ncbi:uncharacterized protein LOC129762529 [Toxorhynchites rutilus septentrionalis]|uniref:uncharacterized protein LOC129762529 n=1 Tax=Toxorhynchites rutilus septentrionalis TaxID=329112 RepID=UPI00247A2580|nr:uncharacterized protein LOC129762529 [Toxorhynchites rutilus septentrionalis]
MEQLQLQTTELPFCRLCFTQGVELYEIFPGAGNDNESLLIKIMDCVTVAITFDDDYNSYICAKCVTTVEEFYDYKEKCKENDALLREKRKSVEQTAIYNVVNMQSEEEVVNGNGSNGATQELGTIDDQQMTLEHRISIEGGPPLNGNIIEFKKQLFTASPEQLGIWICVASGSDIQCPAMIQVDENVQVVAEIGQHNHGLPVSVTDNPPQEQKPQLTPQPPPPQQQHQQQTIIPDDVKPPIMPSTSTPTGVSASASKKRKAKDQPNKRKISNDILVGDGWLIDVETQKRHHYQLVTKDGYQTFLIFNGYRFRTQQKIRNGIASWKCAWNGRKGCQAVLNITEDYQKVKEVGNPHNHEPSLRDRMITGKPTNGSDAVLLASDGEESLHAGAEMQHITITGAVGGHGGSSSSSNSAHSIATTLGNIVTAMSGGPTSTVVTSNAIANLDAVTSTAVSHHSSSLEHLSTSEIVDFVQQSSNGSDQLVTTVVDADVHHAAVVGGVGSVVSVVDDDVGKDDAAMSMDIEEIIRPHVVLHSTTD